MKKTIQHIKTEKRKKYLDSCIRNEIIFWIEYNVYNPAWQNEPLKYLVKKNWANEDNGIYSCEDDINYIVREDKFDGIFYESEHYVNFLVDQVGYKCHLKLDCEKTVATITTLDVIKMVWQLKGLIKTNGITNSQITKKKKIRQVE